MWKQPNIYREMNKENVIYTYNGILFTLKQKGHPAICDNMDELCQHCAKWNRPVTEEQTLSDYIYVRHTKESNSWKQKVEWFPVVVGKGKEGIPS